jgi:hypothetical protein
VNSYQRRIAERDEAQKRARDLQASLSQTQAELTQLREKVALDVQKIADHMVKARVENETTPYGRRFRIVTDIDERAVHDSLFHGDNSVVRYIGERIGIQVAREIASLNFHRAERVPQFRGGWQ